MSLPSKPAAQGEPDRYVVISEPSGSWTVWDERGNEPATLAGSVLSGLAKLRADAACGILNRIDRMKRG